MGRLKQLAEASKSSARSTASSRKELLKNNKLLQVVQITNLLSLPKMGTLVWAKHGASVYWPGFIASMRKVELEEETVDPKEFAFVVFLEKRFRIGPILWDKIIIINETKMEVQTEFVIQFNKTVVKKGWSPNATFREALELLCEFSKMEALSREGNAEELFNREFGEKITKQRKRLTDPPCPVSSDNSNCPRRPAEGGPYSLLQQVTTAKIARQKNRRYSLRDTPSPVQKNTDASGLGQLPKKSKSSITLAKTDVNNNMNNSNISTTVPSPMAMKNKKTGRPLLGGELLKDWTKEQFNKIDKKFVFESIDELTCAACKLKIAKDVLYCHDYPFHKKCLEEVSITSIGSEVIKKIWKCVDCIEKRCFICKKTEHSVKCSKCQLRFHRDCLKRWPQATVQGSQGPITCPLHFCHTCKAEERCLNKMRNAKLTNNKAFRCIHCLSAYHKTGCLPAGCGATVTGNTFIECPKHFNKEIVTGIKKSRRLGCFACNKRLVEKEEHVECQICSMIFHPICIGYTDEERQNGTTLIEFSRDFQCNTCCWGLFPLYGQVVWFQQPGSSFWPARILYPKESAVRNKEKAGCYSIVYFGSLPSYFDVVTQAVPFHITGLDFLTKLNLYNEKPVLLTAYEEAGYSLNHSEAHRDSFLPKPEPDYKKIDRNYYRHSFGFSKRIDINKIKPDSITGDALRCNCEKLTEGKACVLNVGCYNRDASVECHPSICSAPDRCNNRMFSLPSKANDHVECFSTEKKGWGVKATRDIPEGDFIIEYIGEVISRSDMHWRASRKYEEDPLYILDLGSNLFIDAEFVGNISRLINHSCEPNCITEKYISLGRPVVGVFAARDIECGEELTFNYAYGKNSAAPFKCHCNTENCKGYIGRKVVENEENLKPNIKRKRSIAEDEAPAEPEDQWNNNCEVCTFGGHVILCDFDDCRKVFHLKCAGLKKAPRGVWICPIHAQKQIHAKTVKKKKKKIQVAEISDESPISEEVMDVGGIIASPISSIPKSSEPTKRKAKSRLETRSYSRIPVKGTHARSRTLKSLNTSL